MIEKIILGTVQLGLPYGINNIAGKPSPDQAFDILDKSWEIGIRSLDTAIDYGDSQEVLGEYFISRRNSFEVLSKFKISNDKSIEMQFFDTLKTLSLTSLCCFSHHQVTDISRESLKQLAPLKEKGILKKIGVSVYSNEDLEKMIYVDEIDVIQLPFNLLDNWKLRGELISKAISRNKEIHIRSAFLQGLFFKKPTELGLKFSKLAQPLQKLTNLSHSLDITLPELALYYCLSFSEISKVLIGVEKASQLDLLESLREGLVTSDVKSEIEKIEISDIELLDPRAW